MQIELTQPGQLLKPDGKLASVGWARHPLLDCNLEAARFYRLQALQFLRIKRWDYYAVFTPQHFFSATIADLGYAGNIFVYHLDFESGDLHEEGLVIPLGKGITLPRNSTQGDTHFENNQVKLDFFLRSNWRHLAVTWPGFNNGKGLRAEIDLLTRSGDESMNIVIPIAKNRFYYNRKINCMPASGTITYGGKVETLESGSCLGSLDWGRGVWEYKSFWNWASASGFLPDGRSIGLNLGMGFGDQSRASENAIILDRRIHKLDYVKFDYVSGDYMRPWHITDSEGRLDLVVTPFKDRTAVTNLKVITSEVHQMFGHYDGTLIADDGEKIKVRGLLGFAEEHRAKW